MFILTCGWSFWTFWTFAICVISSAPFGVLPAFLSTRVQVAESLKIGGRGATMDRRSFANALIVSQVGFALVLLVASGLLLRTFERLVEIKPGFVPDNVLTMRFSLPVAAINSGKLPRQHLTIRCTWPPFLHRFWIGFLQCLVYHKLQSRQDLLSLLRATTLRLTLRDAKLTPPSQNHSRT